jgi:hypothetical protein
LIAGLNDGSAPAAGTVLRLIGPFQEMFADNCEAVSDYSPVGPGQALDLLGHVFPIDLIGRATTECVGLLLGPRGDVGLVKLVH